MYNEQLVEARAEAKRIGATLRKQSGKWVFVVRGTNSVIMTCNTIDTAYHNVFGGYVEKMIEVTNG